MTIRSLVPLPVRRHFRDLSASYSTLRLIAGMWEDQGFTPSGEPNNESGERRGFWREFEDNVDWTDPGHVNRVVRVYETLVDAITPEELASTRKFMDRQGFDVDAEGRIRPKSNTALAMVAAMPRSLNTLRDPAMILDSFERINRALPTDPAQAIGSAKELVEATAKTVLEELGVPFEDKTAKLPQLIDRAQRELGLHPQTAAPGPDGSQAVKRILGGLSGIALGLGELRNEGWGTGHAARRTGLRPRHGYLAVGAAHTWCQVVLDTLADPSAPWRTQVADATAG
ncbi:abortive infection family protein [Polymorphospora lycopeni]|uniref:Abortive infection family protein n=1 Tax=Polymorphospora lycopeni TaxID=3140240 RepID=A0ABV5D238_9ACTN